MKRNNDYMKKANTDWFKDAKYGLFFHYLLSQDTFKNIEHFDVNAFAEDCSLTGAGYVIFTLGQNSGYYCAPNETYNQYAGYASGERWANRDLPLELSEALGKKGIRLMLYLPSNAPCEDAQAAEGLGLLTLDHGHCGTNWHVTDNFRTRWSEVIQELSIRYGDKVAGWWFDGFYEENGFDESFAAAYNQAVKSGNHEALFCVNPGLMIEKVSDQEDYTAGEMVYFEEIPSSRWKDGIQWHILSWMASDWGKVDDQGPRYDIETLGAYIRNVNAQCGVVSIDLPMAPVPYAGDRIKPDFLESMRKISEIVHAG